MDIGGSPSVIPARGSKEKMLEFVFVEAAIENWDLDGVMTAAKINVSGPRGKYREWHAMCWEAHTEVFAGFVDVVCITKRIITLEENVRKRYIKLQKTQR